MRKLIAIGFFLLVVGDVAPTPTPTPRPTSSATPMPTPGPAGPVFYAASNGSARGNGSISSPWDIQTALNQPAAVQCGSTIYVRGGTVSKKFIGRLRGCSDSNRIVFRSYPGEWFRIDGYVQTILVEPLPAGRFTDEWVRIRVANPSVLPLGGPTYVGTESLYVGRTFPDGTTEVIRGLSGSRVVAHAAGEAVHSTAAVLDIQGQFADYRDFEVFSSQPDRVFLQNVVNGVYPRSGGIVNNSNNGIRLINLVIHDLLIGVWANTGSTELEMYGTLLYNNGYSDTIRAHGQGFYWENEVGQKRIRNTFDWNEFGGSKIFGESGFAQNVLIEDLVSSNQCSPGTFPGNPGYGAQPYPPQYRCSNFFVGTGNMNRPTNDIKIRGGFFYLPPDTWPEGGNLGLGYQAGNAERLEILDTNIIGGDDGLQLKGFKSGTVQRNLFYAQRSGNWGMLNRWEMLVHATLQPGFSFTWNNNTYHDALPQYEQRVSYPFQFAVGSTQSEACGGGAALKWDDQCNPPQGGWRQISGFDSASTWTRSAPPLITKVLRNEFDANRWHVTIFNPGLLQSVVLAAPAGLSNDDRYDLFAVEEGRWSMGTPTATGIVSNGQITVPMAPGPVAVPIGLNWAPNSTRPRFGAFILIRKP